MNVLIKYGKQLYQEHVKNYPTDNGAFNYQPDETILEIFKNLSFPSDTLPLVCKKFAKLQRTYIDTHKLGVITFDMGTLDIFKKEISLTKPGDIETRRQFCWTVAETIPKSHCFVAQATSKDHFYAAKRPSGITVVYQSITSGTYTLQDNKDEIKHIEKNYKLIKFKMEL